jgi:hypothetical protein
VSERVSRRQTESHRAREPGAARLDDLERVRRRPPADRQSIAPNTRPASSSSFPPAGAASAAVEPIRPLGDVLEEEDGPARVGAYGVPSVATRTERQPPMRRRAHGRGGPRSGPRPPTASSGRSAPSGAAPRTGREPPRQVVGDHGPCTPATPAASTRVQESRGIAVADDRLGRRTSGPEVQAGTSRWLP